jgi:peptide/nickel transport system ATP-binding protein
MGSIPSIGERGHRLAQIEGAMPRLTEIPTGCAFNPRCPDAGERCTRERPELMAAHTTLAACWQYDRKGVGAPLRREKVDA